jgi:hypothetical protein
MKYLENFTDLQNKLYLLECKQKCYPDHNFFNKKTKNKEREFINTLGKLKDEKGNRIWVSLHSHLDDDKLYNGSTMSDLSKYVNQKSKKKINWPVITCNRYCKPIEYSKNNIVKLEKSNPELFWIKELKSPVGGNHSIYR